VDEENDEQKDITEMTPMNTTIGARITRSSSRNLAVGKR
jgi:hypothetical protein